MGDPWRLERFVAAQERGGTYQRAVTELQAGTKVSHWMWFVFPQVAGLGMSAMSREYAISSVAEARAYLAHPVLGPRLRECARIVEATEGRSAGAIFGPVDAVKLRSSMTLFTAAEADEAEAGGAQADGAQADGAQADGAQADGAEADEAETAETGRAGTAARAGGGLAPGEPGGNVFRAVLAKYFGGAADEETLARLLGPADSASRRADIKENP
jgi:uncharacterized protein (DUF1810 family)